MKLFGLICSDRLRSQSGTNGSKEIQKRVERYPKHVCISMNTFMKAFMSVNSAHQFYALKQKQRVLQQSFIILQYILT